MTPDQPEIETQQKKSKLYFFLASASLLVMGFVWALDSSIVYFFLGIGVYFLFLTFWNRPRTPKETINSDNYKKDQTDDPSDWLADLEKKLQPSTQPKGYTQNPERKVTLFAALFIFIIFFTIVVSVIFSDHTGNSGFAFVYFETAERLRDNGQIDSAVYYYQKAFEENPDYDEALNSYGYMLMIQEKYDTAILTFNRALKANPENTEARYNKALTLQYKKNYPESLREAFQLMKDNPNNFGSMVLAGDSYYLQQRYDSAIYWYNDAYANGERSAWLCHVMAYINDTKGNTEKAIPLYKEALTYDSTRTEIYDRLGELFPGQDGQQYRDLANLMKTQK